MKTSRVPLVAAVLFVLAVPTLLFGHAVVFPKASTTGAYERYVLRVPNEKEVATQRVEIRFPADLRVTSFADVAGWQLEVLTDSAKHIVGAVWTGTLPPKRFAEFPFVAANPKVAGMLTWPVYQSYEGGERVEWTGAAGSKSPASVTTLSVADGIGTSPTKSATTWVPWLALGISVIALGLAMRRPAA